MLRRAGSDPSVTLIFLKTGDAATKTIAASTIAATGKWAREAVPLLAESLKSDDQAFRTAGLTALTKVGPEAIPVLLDAARAGDMAVIKSFPKMGVPAVTPLMQLTEHKDQTIRLAAVAALGEVRPFSKEVLGHLRKLREGGDEKVRNAVVRVLIPLETPGPENLDFLLLELQEKKSENRRAAGQQLVRIPALAMPRLIELVEKSPDFGVRAEAIFTLGQMGLAAAPAVKPLIDLVRSDKAENQPLKIYALSALDRMHPEANAGLLAILVDAEAPAQVAVLEMLRPEQVKLAKDLVIELLRSKSPEVRTTAARGAGQGGAQHRQGTGTASCRQGRRGACRGPAGGGECCRRRDTGQVSSRRKTGRARNGRAHPGPKGRRCPWRAGGGAAVQGLSRPDRRRQRDHGRRG